MKTYADFVDEQRRSRARKFNSGMTLEEIAAEEGVSRQAIQQSIAKMGVTRLDGGANKRAADKIATYRKRLDADSMRRWGIPHKEKRRLSANGVIERFVRQRQAAKNRGIAWRLQFIEWWGIWRESGKWAQRGRGDGYCMARFNDEGAYEIGNVSIQTCAENSSDGFAKAREAGKKYPRGVFCTLPGTTRPFIAKYSKKVIGRYATAEEATEARRKWMEVRGL